jgi:hypothetical protein
VRYADRCKKGGEKTSGCFQLPPHGRLAMAAMGKPKSNVADLCQELGVTRQTLYRHVSSDRQPSRGRAQTSKNERVTNSGALGDLRIFTRGKSTSSSLNIFKGFSVYAYLPIRKSTPASGGGVIHPDGAGADAKAEAENGGGL